MVAALPVAELLPAGVTFLPGRLTAAGLCTHTHICYDDACLLLS